MVTKSQLNRTRTWCVATSVLPAIFALLGAGTLSGADLREATFTQVVNTVNVAEADGGSPRLAQVNTKFTSPQIIRTGSDSRAELTAADQTVTRVGANTIFSFKPEGRGINLQQGSVLFNSPTGRGGGTIQTAAATASVLGTTIIVSTTSNGGFKLLVLEGHARATLPNGRTLDLLAGQMTFFLPGATRFSPVIQFRLGKQNSGSNLVKGFGNPLPAQDKVNNAIQRQDLLIAKGDAVDTQLMIGDVIGKDVQVVDPSVLSVVQQQLGGGDLIGRFKQELEVDQVFTTSTLDSSSILYFPTSAALTQALAAVGSKYGTLNDPPSSCYGIAGNTITFQTSNVDLTPYANAPTFAFYAQSAMTLSSGLSFTGFGGDVVLHSDGSLSIPTSGMITFNCASAELEAYDGTGLSLTSGAISNASGSLTIKNLGGGLSMNGNTLYAATELDLASAGNMTGSYVTFNVSTALNLESGGNLTLGTISFTSPNCVVSAFSGGNMSLGGMTLSVSSLELGANGTLGIGGTYNVNNSISLTGSSVSIGTTSLSSLLGSIDVTASTGDISTTGYAFTASNSIAMTASGNLTTTDTNYTASTINMRAVVGTLNLVNGAFTANNESFTGHDISVGTTPTTDFICPSGAGTVSFSANMTSGAITMFNVDFGTGLNFSTVSMQAYTIFLTNVNFGLGQQVNLTSGLTNGGVPLFGSVANPGHVTFNTVYYGGNLLNSSNISSYNGYVHVN